MVDELEVLLPGDSGQGSQVQCFCHIINLVTKSVLSLFDSPKTKKTKHKATNLTQPAKQQRLNGTWEVSDIEEFENDKVDMDVDSASKLLDQLGGRIDEEEEEAEDQLEERGDEADNTDGWIDEHQSMPSGEQADVQRNMLPVRMMLVKVRVDACLPCLSLCILMSPHIRFARFPLLSKIHQPSFFHCGRSYVPNTISRLNGTQLMRCSRQHMIIAKYLMQLQVSEQQA